MILINSRLIKVLYGRSLIEALKMYLSTFKHRFYKVLMLTLVFTMFVRIYGGYELHVEHVRALMSQPWMRWFRYNYTLLL